MLVRTRRSHGEDHAKDDRVTTAAVHTKASIRALLDTIPDPEVPAISIVELGIIRDISITDDEVTISITPTYSGCPAMHTIQQEIRQVCREHGIVRLTILTILAPAWSTDWMDDSAREKLRAYGIAPPLTVAASPLLQIDLPAVPCPHCRSQRTTLKSEFGSTACKAYYYCDVCLQPFEYFKSF